MAAPLGPVRRWGSGDRPELSLEQNPGGVPAFARSVVLPGPAAERPPQRPLAGRRVPPRLLVNHPAAVPQQPVRPPAGDAPGPAPRVARPALLELGPPAPLGPAAAVAPPGAPLIRHGFR